MKHAIISVALGLSLLFANGGIVYAQDFNKGLEAAQKGDFATALNEWRPLAQQGDADAQYNLGSMYGNGQGVTQDFTEALKWYRLSAAQGNANAQFNLGTMFDQGRGVRQDLSEALRWYSLSAAQGTSVAQFNLGTMYGTGRGVTQDYIEALKWYRLSAAQGNANAQASLGTMYLNGEGIIRNDIYAHMWLSLAASSGNLNTLKNRDLVAKRMTEADISKAQNLARECVRKNYKDCGSSGLAEDVNGLEWKDFIGILMLLVTVGIATFAYSNLKRRTGG